MHKVGRGYRARAARLLLAAAAAAPVALVPLALVPGSVRAADPTPSANSAATRYQATFVARVCPSYAAVMANQFSADGAESLVRPGRDSAYRPGQPVDPDVEAVGDECEPLVDWRFTLGSGRDHSGALSVVAGATVTTGPTAEQTPRLDPVGRPTGRMLSGGVTLLLTDEQLRLAGRRQLWVQGGTPADPLLAAEVPAGGYGFGVLRCGTDGRTGANAQWLSFASGVRHAFCYAYYVRGAPQAGAVTVRVRPTRALGYPRPFAFTSPLSFAPGGEFSLASSQNAAEVSYVRAAGGSPYPVQLQLPSGWQLAELACAAARPSGGAAMSTMATDRTAARATVSLVAGEVVTCTFAVDPPAAPPGLSLAVYAENGGGTFGVTLDGGPATGGTATGGPVADDGLTAARTLTATPGSDAVAVPATGADLAGLPAGAYQVTLRPPAGQTTLWSLASVTCNGVSSTGTGLSTGLNLAVGVPTECVLRLTHRPGSLQLHVVTAGGVAGAGFAVAPGDAVALWWAAANTTGSGVAEPASGDLPRQLPFGEYLLTPIPPRSTADGSWQLTSLGCDPGQAVAVEPPPVVAGVSPPASATLRLSLGANAPDPVCTASYQLVPSVRLQLVAHADGIPAGRSGPVVVEVSCADGSTGRVVVGVRETGRSLPEALSFAEPTDCSIAQPATGAAAHAAVTASVVVEPAPNGIVYRLPIQLKVARDAPAYMVTITDRFTAASAGPARAGLGLPAFRLPPGYLGTVLGILAALVLAGFVLRRRAAR